jgi:ribulose-5-phosphate 4-epimerase/fuculose-1-phosphate aldolase
MDRDAIFQKIRAVGRAALTAGLENSHSGNIAIKCADESGRELLAITATGSQKGELTPDKICYPSLTGANYGHYKASSETDIHARILSLPGVKASIHGHTRLATVVTLDDAPMPKQNPRAPLRPVDPLGVRHLGEVPVDWVAVASGSKEMTDAIYSRLAERPACLIQAHGTFARGASLEEAFFHLCLAEHAGEVLHFAGLLGVDLPAARAAAEELLPRLREAMPPYSDRDLHRLDFPDEQETVELFRSQGFRIFESRYSPFHTGSMSVRATGSLLYAPYAAMPRDLPGPMLELPLRPDAATATDRGDDLALSRAIFLQTPLKALVHCYPAETEALALKLAANAGGALPKVIPIDAEGGFLYPSVPVLPARPDPDVLCRALLDYRMAVVVGGGVWAAGEQAVGEALRHVSSIKDICFYRIMAQSRGLDLAAMEPERARSW